MTRMELDDDDDDKCGDLENYENEEEHISEDCTWYIWMMKTTILRQIVITNALLLYGRLTLFTTQRNVLNNFFHRLVAIIICVVIVGIFIGTANTWPETVTP